MRWCDEAGMARMSNESVFATIPVSVVLIATASSASMGVSTTRRVSCGREKGGRTYRRSRRGRKEP